MAERIAQKPLFALKLTKQAINAAQDAQGRVSAMQTSFALHHLAHAHNMLAHGKLVDPTGLMPAIKKHQKAAEAELGVRRLQAARQVPGCPTDEIFAHCKSGALPCMFRAP